MLKDISLKFYFLKFPKFAWGLRLVIVKYSQAHYANFNQLIEVIFLGAPQIRQSADQKNQKRFKKLQLKLKIIP